MAAEAAGVAAGSAAVAHGVGTLAYIEGNPVGNHEVKSRNSPFPQAVEGSKGEYQSPYGFPSDPTEPPGKGRGEPGTNRGNWYNPKTKEWLHWDSTHHDSAHFDYQAANGARYRIWEDGSMSVK